ncbi:MAG: hypothetical protein LBJ63_01905 [Prevotellaceae bacterium]|jgi:hypothetical protein|nr:hypothetical protein [Prevotellaceae bacterium]
MEKKFEITKFEALEDSSEMLKGGFSSAYAGSGQEKEVTYEPIVANAFGGNCSRKCVM